MKIISLLLGLTLFCGAACANSVAEDVTAQEIEKTARQVQNLPANSDRAFALSEAIWGLSALDRWEAALQLASSNSERDDIRENWVEARAKSGDIAGALQGAAQIGRLNVRGKALIEVARGQIKAGRREGAISILKRAETLLAPSGQTPLMRNNSFDLARLAGVWALAGDKTQAKKWFERAYFVADENAKHFGHYFPSFIISMIINEQIAAGFPDEALRRFQKTDDRDGNLGLVVQHLAESGFAQRARQLALSPNDKEVRFNLLFVVAGVQTRRGEKAEAIATLEMAEKIAPASFQIQPGQLDSLWANPTLWLAMDYARAGAPGRGWALLEKLNDAKKTRRLAYYDLTLANLDVSPASPAKLAEIRAALTSADRSEVISNPYLLLADLERKLGDLNAARADLEIATQAALAFTSAEPLAEISVLSIVAQKWSDWFGDEKLAQTVRERILALPLKNEDVFGLGEMLVQLGMPEIAWERALKKPDKHSLAELAETWARREKTVPPLAITSLNDPIRRVYALAGWANGLVESRPKTADSGKLGVL